MKLWDKGIDSNDKIEKFTVGKDKELDVFLAGDDIIGSLAHIKMLESIHLLSKKELESLTKELKVIYSQVQKGNFLIEEGIEDVHSQIELLLTRKIGETGKKIHSGRSRNDQVLLDLKLYTRRKLEEIVESVSGLFTTWQEQSEKYKNVLMPGYTHLQVAMPSSFGLWFGAYAESLTDDLQLLLAAFKINNQNPLGSAAGYGSSFPLNRQLTTDLLGFDNMNYNVIYAQMGRGKVEKTIAFALGAVASTLSKFAMDACLFMNQNFGFISLPDELTTGSSIMPHKKNPDVFELIRAKCNKLQGLTNELILITNNLPSGYFRDLQILKESYIPAFEVLLDCLDITNYVVKKMTVKAHILDNDIYRYIFSVEDVNKLVLEGVPFREAYKKIGEEIIKGNYKSSQQVEHTHEGSIGNLCNEKIKEKMDLVLSGFKFDKAHEAIKRLID